MSAPSIRARVRAELTDEIKAVARRHLATDGANLSLRAVARDMGMVSSALYRYFPSRDDLLTTLIIDAYDAIGAAVEAADARVDRTDLRGRWYAVWHAVRDWALANPAEYALIYGSPVPGYAAPQDTIGPAIRTPVTLVRILADGVAAGLLTAPGGGAALPEPVRADVARLVDSDFPGVPAELLTLGMVGWIHLFGAVSFELFGQLNNVIFARREAFQYQMELMADLIGLPA
ncbi:MAG TPA: TetR/AcrR family transcriptional regulator [Micromonosporaceae bacterium]|jgi:AcrR family transcriptional regulator